MSLEQLRTFVAVADEGHVTRAARRLGLSQSPVTRRIQALEAELGRPLLRRVGRNVGLTPFGARFATQARHLLGEADALLATARNDVQE